jgi:hypothetical protein
MIKKSATKKKTTNSKKKNVTVQTTVLHGTAPMSCTWDPRKNVLTIQTYSKLRQLVNHQMVETTKGLENIKQIFANKDIAINPEKIVVKGNLPLPRKNKLARMILTPVIFLIGLF